MGSSIRSRSSASCIPRSSRAYENAAGVASALSSTDFISLYVENYVAVYRTHAAIALAAGPEPRTCWIPRSRANCVLVRRPEPDAQEAVKSVRDTLWAP